MADIIQKAVEHGKCGAAFKKTHPDLASIAASGLYLWQPKYDGVHVIIDTERCCALSREGTPSLSIDHIIESLPKGYVFQGEVWSPGAPFEELSGAYRRRYPQPQLDVVLYDMHHPGAFHAGVNFETYSARLFNLRQLIPEGRITESYLVSKSTDLPAIAKDWVQRGGYDGIVLRDALSEWRVGPAKNGELIKVKPNIDLDLLCVGVTALKGDKTGRAVYKLTVMLNGEEVQIGSGVPYEVEPADYIGKIVQIAAMGYTLYGKLREPRFIRVREDKSAADA